MQRKVNVAIDGLAASGKSTVAKELARLTGLIYLDTGLMYRALALAVSQEPASDDFEAQVERQLSSLGLEVEPPARPGDDCRILIRGEEVTQKLHRPEVSRLVPKVAALTPVRQAMVRQQQQIASRKGMILVGRDIASVVMPDAELKVFLIADLDERARRRHREFIEKGSSIGLEAVRQDLAQRDQDDMERADSPLVCVPDARQLDTTAHTR